MDRALFTGGHEREGGDSHRRSRVLCVRNMWSVTHGGIVRAKSLRPRLRACARLLPSSPHTNRTYMCAHDACLSRLCISYSFPLSSFLVFIASLCLFSLAISSLSLSLQLTTRQRLLTLACWPWVSAAWFVTLAGGRYGIRKYLTGIRRLHLIKFIDTGPDIFHFFSPPLFYLFFQYSNISDPTFPCNEAELKKINKISLS